MPDVLEVAVRGKGTKVKLTDRDFIASGGEGSVYGKGALIYKVYHDPAHALPQQKIDELIALDDPHILRPMDILVDAKGRMVGFTMSWAKDTVRLCELFTNTFWRDHGVTPSLIFDLVRQMQEVIAFIHKHGCVIVDGNEFNYMVDKKDLTHPYFIDVDSYQTPTYPAKAIMPSIRDLHTQGFTTLTDWFSFGIVSCQLFVGMHPFKGAHPRFSKKDLEGRMRANVSIFNSDVSVPDACRDFGNIPSTYKQWYEAMFESGKRLPPPDVKAPAMPIPIKVRVVTVQSGKNFLVELIREFDDQVVDFRSHGGTILVKTATKVYVDNREIDGIKPTEEVVFSPSRNIPIVVAIANGKMELRAKGVVQSAQIDAHNVLVVDNNLYAVNLVAGLLAEIDLVEMGDKIVYSVKTCWNILPNATRAYKGMLLSNVLGKPYAIIPYRKANRGCCAILPIPELVGYKVADAKREKGVVVIIASKGGVYTRFVLRFTPDFVHYDCRPVEDVAFTGINFCVLDSGLVVLINEDDEVEVFPVDPANHDMKVIPDPSINSSTSLHADGARVIGVRGSKIYKVTTRKS